MFTLCLPQRLTKQTRSVWSVPNTTVTQQEPEALYYMKNVVL